jgi:glycine dehydrogenase subunit 1
LEAHKFLPNSEERITEFMLKRLGLKSVDELYSDVPSELLLKGSLNIPEALSELELQKLVEGKLSRNKSYPKFLNFIGGGCQLHYVPSVVDEILARGEFYTSYTPYQPEISQGMLQSLFEYQSQICDLTSMEVANSSMYDWGSALGEAGRMASRVTGRRMLLVANNASPERINILRTYCLPAGISVKKVQFDSRLGTIDLGDLKENLTDEVAAVCFENPNFFGLIEDSAQEISDMCHSKGALSVVGVNPSTLGVLKPPGQYGADIVVGDAQPLGVYPNLGGPLIGLFATKNVPELLRQMPGRLIGLTTEKNDQLRRAFTMVLQTREQHIRRERATSNICTNEALFALAVSIYLALMGPKGMKQIGEHMISKSRYARDRIKEEGLDAPYFSGTFFNEFTVRTKMSSQSLTKFLEGEGILGGLPLGRFYEELSSVSLFSFSELHSLDDIEKLVSALKNAEKT